MAVRNMTLSAKLLVGESNFQDRIKVLYPMVNEAESPLPRSWSPKDKFNFIGLSQNNLRVHYKGHGKGHKDAASVRATHLIPAACGIYYFEVKIVSKGRDGYMGIGLSAHGVNMNRLPGWDKHSYGYHGDDGHSFCSSGTGQPYGPTFTTGDVIGCGVNLLDNTCFYTKNGHHLGVAFTDLPPSLFPTVGLQTPGEIVDANFGQQPFVFDIEDMMKEIRGKTRLTVERFPIPESYRNWEGIMNKMVMSYLVHHGYCSTAEAFAKTCGQAVAEDLVSMQNRQKIQQLVLEGHIKEAEDETKSLYPNLLDSNPDLLFMLRCRHFVELVGQSMTRKDRPNEDLDGDATISSSSNYCNGDGIRLESPDEDIENNCGNKNGEDEEEEDMEIGYSNNGYPNGCGDEMEVEIANSSSTTLKKPPNSLSNSSLQSDSSSDMCNGETSTSSSNNDASHEMLAAKNGQVVNGKNKDKCKFPNPPTESSITSLPQHGSNGLGAVEQLLQVGRDLQALSVSMRRIYGHNDSNKKLMQNAFSLLAYADPWESPMGWQLSSSEREPVCAALNSAILQSIQLPRTPPLQVGINHAHLLLSQMARSGLGACAFIDLDMQADVK
ncbi:ran-binding protein 9 [Folsomia candida]|nr:ran-binding protein 9 [Folsomia candida]XP_021952320.1 ran-binding protein 9 [Folsomia candida]XP_035709440.1 ran-binding protein 9 [Folsomia candida]